jgi:RNA polymerase II-associated factor 1
MFMFMLSVSRRNEQESIDISREAQIRDIESSFDACNDLFALESLAHPNKPNVTAVDSYEFLPDIEIWPNQYDLFRFPERPGDRPLDVSVRPYSFNYR